MHRAQKSWHTATAKLRSFSWTTDRDAFDWGQLEAPGLERRSRSPTDLGKHAVASERRAA
jgi:hypothetical protein